MRITVLILSAFVASAFGGVAVRMPFVNPAGVTYVDGSAHVGLAAGPVLRAAPVAAPLAAPLAYHQAAPLAYQQAAPLAYHQPAPVAYHQAAPLAYQQAAPLAYHQPAPVAYHQAAPLAYHHAAPVAYAPKYAAVPTVQHVPGVADVPVTRYEAQPAVIQKTVDVARPAVKTRKFEIRRPAIQKQFYDIEERVIVKNAGSAVVELDEPVSTSQKGGSAIQTTGPLLVPTVSHGVQTAVSVPSVAHGFQARVVVPGAAHAYALPGYASKIHYGNYAHFAPVGHAVHLAPAVPALPVAPAYPAIPVSTPIPSDGIPLSTTTPIPDIDGSRPDDSQQQPQQPEQQQGDQPESFDDESVSIDNPEINFRSAPRSEQEARGSQFQSPSAPASGPQMPQARSMIQPQPQPQSQAQPQPQTQPQILAAFRSNFGASQPLSIPQPRLSDLIPQPRLGAELVPSLRNGPEVNQGNQQRLIQLLTARGGVTEVGLGRAGPAGAPLGDAGQVRARVLSATPAPDQAEPTGERVNTRRVVVSRPIETLQEIEVAEPVTKLERIHVNHPTFIKTARQEIHRVPTSYPVYGKALAPIAPTLYHQKAFAPALSYY